MAATSLSRQFINGRLIAPAIRSGIIQLTCSIYTAGGQAGWVIWVWLPPGTEPRPSRGEPLTHPAGQTPRCAGGVPSAAAQSRDSDSSALAGAARRRPHRSRMIPASRLRGACRGGRAGQASRVIRGGMGAQMVHIGGVLAAMA
jgi:hypothetical protein